MLVIAALPFLMMMVLDAGVGDIVGCAGIACVLMWIACVFADCYTGYDDGVVCVVCDVRSFYANCIVGARDVHVVVGDVVVGSITTIRRVVGEGVADCEDAVVGDDAIFVIAVDCGCCCCLLCYVL